MTRRHRQQARRVRYPDWSNRQIRGYCSGIGLTDVPDGRTENLGRFFLLPEAPSSMRHAQLGDILGVERDM
jgi:hypothetical protein